MPGVVTYKLLLFLLAMTCSAPMVRAQYFSIAESKKRVTIPFKIVRSLVIIKLNINNKGPFNFILDTGVGLMLITDPSLADSLNVENKRTIKISGLGQRDDYEAFVVPVLNVDIDSKLFSNNVSAAILKDDFFGLSNYAGVPIHGLLGYDFFNRLALKVSFTDSVLIATPPGKMRIFRKSDKVPLTIAEGKPYMESHVTLLDGTNKKVKLLVDLGAGHALSLENVDSLPQKSIRANLGIGLNGLIDGYLGRIENIDMGKHRISNIITSFPLHDISRKTSVPRDGSVGINLLKRFDIIFDYPHNMMYLRPNSRMKQNFEHDMSGLSYYVDKGDFNRVIVEKVDEGSPAEEVGIVANDEIISINFKPVKQMSLQQIDDLFKSKDGRGLLLELARDEVRERVVLTLKRRI